jgi:hypothetical protein
MDFRKVFTEIIKNPTIMNVVRIPPGEAHFCGFGFRREGLFIFDMKSNYPRGIQI